MRPGSFYDCFGWQVSLIALREAEAEKTGRCLPTAKCEEHKELRDLAPGDYKFLYLMTVAVAVEKFEDLDGDRVTVRRREGLYAS